jgi:DnaJ-class molecular chaperone
LTPQEVKRARQLLQLPERASLRQVKAAYHRLARKFHPDLNPEDTSAQTHPSTGSGHRFDEAHKAYQILVDYCMSQLDGNRSYGAADQGRVVSFAPADVRGAFLVAISQSTTA